MCTFSTSKVVTYLRRYFFANYYRLRRFAPCLLAEILCLQMSWFVLSSLSTSTSPHFPLQSNRYNSSFAAARTTIHNISDKKMFFFDLIYRRINRIYITPKLPKIWKRWQMVRKFTGKISRKWENRWISEMRIIQPRVLKILGAKLNGKKSSGKKFLKIWVYHAKWSFLSESLENAVFYSLLEVAENSDLMQNMQIVQKK